MQDSRRVTRITVLAAIVFAVMMIGVPSFVMNGKTVESVGQASAADVERLFIIGTPELTISTLNVFTYTMADEYMVIWPCASTLLTYDADMNRIGDLATSWTMSPDGLTWTFEIVNNAYFIDRLAPTSTSHPLTVNDIIYTYWLIQNYTHNLHFYFPAGTIEWQTRINDYKFEIKLTEPFAPFLGALTSIPIVPKYYWEPLLQAPATGGNPGKVTGVLPIGSGPFYYDLPGLPQTGEVVMKRSLLWFQEVNRGWQIHVDTLKLKDMTDASTAFLELKLGNIDVMMGVPPSVYISDVMPGTTPYVEGFAQSTGFVYEFNMNQMSTEMRAALQKQFPGGFKGSNSQILLDPVVKEALAMSVNKAAFIAQVLGGLGTEADSLIADVNPWYYHYGSMGETPIEFNTLEARRLLWDNGWKYDAAGNEVLRDGTQTPLYGYWEGDLAPLSFRFVTLSDASEWAIGAQLIAGWADDAGVQLNLEIKSVNQMNSIWWAADYDTWLWDWMFTPMSDPSTDVLSVLTTMEIGSWSDIYYHNATFDDLYNQSVRAMDPVARGEIVDQMQIMAYEDMSCWTVAYRKELYAVSTREWTGYGDWEAQFLLMPDQGLPWMYMMISPNGPNAVPPNTAPDITSLSGLFQGEINQPITFTGLATDASTLQYQWYWGDGTKSGWLTPPGTITKAYSKDGFYTVYFAAKEVTATDDSFITWKKTTVKVVDPSNTPPRNLAIGMVPPSGIDTGTVITFTGSAIDDQGDTLYYSWTFDDGYSAQGDVVEHQYVTPGSYTVTMSVDDLRQGTGTRPVSTTKLVSVTENLPPTIDVPDYPNKQWKVEYVYTVTASDPDGDPLRYTWYWGDGDVSVTTANSASHTYYQKKPFTLTVHADDLTGLPGHNVSDSGTVYVTGINNLPVLTSFEVDKTDVYTGEPVTFRGVGSDPDGDELTFTFTFGDGTQEVVAVQPLAGVNAYVNVTTAYSSAGTFTAYLSLFDGVATIVSAGEEMTVTANSAPMYTPLSDVTATMGVEKTFEITDAYDLDDDPLTYTWEFLDGTGFVNGNPVTHTFTDTGTFVYRVYVNDSHGHNVSSAAVVTVSAPPFTMNLVAGWNLVSVPRTDHGYKASTLGLMFGDVVAGWDPATQSYDLGYIVGISPPTSDFDILPSTGYWVYAGMPEMLVLSGDLPNEPQSRVINVPIGSGGWVIVGIVTASMTMHASDIPLNYSGSIALVAAYDPVTQTYTAYYTGLPFTDYLLVPGQGYWCWCDDSGVLTYVP